MSRNIITPLMAVGLGWATALAAQTPAVPRDSLRLPELVDEALNLDPRQRLVRLQSDETALHEQNLKSGYLPSISAKGYAQYQSDVVTAPFPPPPGQPGIVLRKDTYDMSVFVDQAVYDPSIAPRRAAERASLRLSQSGVAASLYGIREQVTDAFFMAAALEQRAAEIRTTIAGLEAQLSEAAARVRAGTALAGDTAMIAATLVQRRQDELQLGSDRTATLARLGELIGRPVSEAQVLILPDLAAEVAAIRSAMDTLKARPEFAQYAAQRDQLTSQMSVEGATAKPRVGLYGRLGYGAPGLDFLNNAFDVYGIIGVEVKWAPFDWGVTGRRKEALEIQRQMAATNEAAFARDLKVAIQSDLATLDRLQITLAMDDQIVALRENTEREARVRLAEGAVTTAEYVDRNTELLSARLAWAQHRVQLAQTQAELLTLLGAEVR
ncbi:MAG TPA: TolC family protein [Gemmatimonadales bacterium]|nr:TolC family protein [Gemmatimonadales bacterium]